jgi:hypothetical protein
MIMESSQRNVESSDSTDDQNTDCTIPTIMVNCQLTHNGSTENESENKNFSLAR